MVNCVRYWGLNGLVVCFLFVWLVILLVENGVIVFVWIFLFFFLRVSVLDNFNMVVLVVE